MRARSIFTALILIGLAPFFARGAERNTGPWDVKRLAVAPKAEWGKADGLVQPVTFVGEPYQGKPTRVFAYYAKPAGKGPFPAMVLLHGGGGKAFSEWAKLWAERGYAAIAMDLAGNGPDSKRLADGGPDQSDTTKFSKFDDDKVREMWTYHAVADALLAHSLLAVQPEVDAQRIGVTGISWGGYLTCIVAGVDERLKVAVPVYGCGFLQEDSCWVDGYFKKMEDPQRERWVKQFDPSSYLSGVSCPILFVNGTNDFAYPLDSYQKSYQLVDTKLRNLCVTVNMPHGHPQGWAPKEIGAFVDQVLRDDKPLGLIEKPQVDRTKLFAKVRSDGKLVGQLHYSVDVGPWQKRTWKSIAAEVADGKVSATIPMFDRDIVMFFTAKDERDLTVSSPHLEMTVQP